MDIAVRHLLDANKLTTFFKIDSQIAAVLIAAGLACQYVAPAPPPEIRTWSIGHPPNGAADVWLIIWASNDGSRQYFTGATFCIPEEPTSIRKQRLPAGGR